jgi:hypothetical protein
MKTLFTVAITGALALAFTAGAQTQTGCASCGHKPSPDAAPTRPIPGTNESMPVGRIENIMPIGVLAALGCETCAGEAVSWALQQGSSTDDVDRALRTVAAMPKLDCFKRQFGPDAAARVEKALAAARTVLAQAIGRAREQSSPGEVRD